MGAWDFSDSTVILQQCSFINNTSRNGGAISLTGPYSRLIIRGRSRVSQNLFYNNTGSYAGAIEFYGEQFQIVGKYTNFTNNQGDYVGAIALLGQNGYDITQVNISGAVFVDNLSTRVVRTK
jgi:predicted outer membrane repeat protein